MQIRDKDDDNSDDDDDEGDCDCDDDGDGDGDGRPWQMRACGSYGASFWILNTQPRRQGSDVQTTEVLLSRPIPSTSLPFASPRRLTTHLVQREV